MLKSLLAGTLFLGIVTTNAADIVDTAVKAGKFKTLVAAVKAADLVNTLKGKGPFTVFAPTDDAFAKLPKGTLESLLKPENKEKLKNILTYHVVAAKVPSSAVSTTKVKMVNGQKANLKVDNKKVTIYFLNQSTNKNHVTMLKVVEHFQSKQPVGWSASLPHSASCGGCSTT